MFEYRWPAVIRTPYCLPVSSPLLRRAASPRSYQLRLPIPIPSMMPSRRQRAACVHFVLHRPAPASLRTSPTTSSAFCTIFSILRWCPMLHTVSNLPSKCHHVYVGLVDEKSRLAVRSDGVYFGSFRSLVPLCAVSPACGKGPPACTRALSRTLFADRNSGEFLPFRDFHWWARMKPA